MAILTNQNNFAIFMVFELRNLFVWSKGLKSTKKTKNKTNKTKNKTKQNKTKQNSNKKTNKLNKQTKKPKKTTNKQNNNNNNNNNNNKKNKTKITRFHNLGIHFIIHVFIGFYHEQNNAKFATSTVYSTLYNVLVNPSQYEITSPLKSLSKLIILY